MANQWLQRRKDKAQELAHRFFSWGKNATSTDVLKSSHRSVDGEWATRHPQYFPDIDTLAALFRRFSEYGKVSGYIGGHSYEVHEILFYESAKEVASRPLPERRRITMNFTVPERGSVVVTFQQAQEHMAATTILDCQDRSIANTIAQEIVGTTSPLPRKMRRKHIPLIEPIDAAAEYQVRHNANLTKKARRSGAISGAVTAIVVSVSTLIIQAMTAGN